MDPRQVIGLAVVLHRQLPVAGDLDGEGGVGAAMAKAREVEVPPALGDGSDEGVEVRRLPGEVDEDAIAPAGGAHRLKAMPGLVESVAEIGRAHVRTPVTNAHTVCRLL